MIEKVIMRLSYGRLKDYMINALGYSENHTVRSINALRKTDPKVLVAFISWFYTGKFSEKPLYGVNAAALSKHRNLDPVATFLTIDWMAREPEIAKKALSSTHDSIDTEESPYLDEIMRKNDWNNQIASASVQEDKSDIVVTDSNSDEASR